MTRIFFRSLLLFFFCASFLASSCVPPEVYGMYTNSNSSSKKKGDYKEFIRWEGPEKIAAYTYSSSWTTLPQGNIQRAIKEIPAQGGFGSCTVNSSARALLLIGLGLKYGNYRAFLRKSKHYAATFKKYRAEMQSHGEGNDFDDMVAVQTKMFKGNKTVEDSLFKEYFDDGSSFKNIAEYIRKEYGHKVYVSPDRYSYFSSCEAALQKNILNDKATIGSFRGSNGGGHAMNIIGYQKQYGGIDAFLILNTWGGSKTLGYMTRNDTQRCLNRGSYSIMTFQKK